MKYLLYGIVIIVSVIFILNSIDINGLSIIITLIEWATRFILPWITLYWFVQFIKKLKTIND
ncbi:hypothetical protein BKP45_15255 [Anaerobacillus alkalidiazotrophicus]|uniref:Uncharacterized protein n=1 Tax=Anaerobacillus alkalidiazotrophicus TaxID=472963 RepID=A0A1S2M5H4_9BACI|nr:hypothetical protein BKP45_15255 [Anaerobacillus alkalidiazotrophicus]